jgi:hypothetical protein
VVPPKGPERPERAPGSDVSPHQKVRWRKAREWVLAVMLEQGGESSYVRFFLARSEQQFEADGSSHLPEKTHFKVASRALP